MTTHEQALRALAQAYDREDAAQRGEPDPWNLDDPGDICDSDKWVSERLACARVAAEAFLSALTSEDAAGLVERLRQYEGRQWETTACYNGTRDEAASALSAAYASLAAKDQLIESLMAERDAAQFAARNGDSLSSDAIHAVREMLKGAGVPMAAFIDDHVGNAIVQRNQERTRAEAAEARVVELEKALDALDRMSRGVDWCDQDEQARRWSAARRALEACGTTEAIEAVAASLSGTPSPIPGDTPK